MGHDDSCFAVSYWIQAAQSNFHIGNQEMIHGYITETWYNQLEIPQGFTGAISLRFGSDLREGRCLAEELQKAPFH